MGVGSKNSMTSVRMLDTAVAMYRMPVSRHAPVWMRRSNALRTGLQWKSMMMAMATV